MFLSTLTFGGCNGKTAKQGKEKEVLSEALTVADSAKVSSKEDSVTVTVSKEVVQTSQDTIDLDKIYEESEVLRAFPSLDNSQFMDFISKNFKYPDIEPVNGKGWVDLVIERDGTVSDVIIVEGIHPAIDKEFIRVFKLFPKFTPGKINGTSVRSKFRAAINAATK